MNTSSPDTTGIVDELDRILGGDVGDANIIGHDPLTPSPHRLADASAAAIAAFGKQVAALAGKSPITIRASDAIDQLRAAYLTTLNGQPVHRLAEDPSSLVNNGFYQARDDRWICLISTFPHQRDAICRVLDCPPLKDRIAAAVRYWDAYALENAVCESGGVAAVVRSAEEWASHPVGAESATHPVIRIEKVGDSEPESLPCGDQWPPLSDLRALDLTHVIAGPVSGKLLGALGADVLHISRPDLPDPIAMTAITGGGKYNAYCDIRDTAQAAQLHELAAGSDIFINSYLGMQRRGFGADALAALRPGIVVLEYHCWGSDSAWSERGGLDQLACAATGFAKSEGAEGAPSLPPTQLLNDYLAAYLGAAGVISALRKRAAEGGSWRVRIELARVCTWVRSLGTIERERYASIAEPGAASIATTTVDGPLGRLVEPVIPIEFDGLSTPHPGPPRLLGSSPLRWW